MNLLTIAIPTYNRSWKAIEAVKALLEEDLSDTQITIIDNCSDDIVEEKIREAIPELPTSIKFIRNTANVGLAANICRCYEYAETPWIWTLGDDDKIVKGCVIGIVNILRNLDEDQHISFIQLSTTIHRYSTESIASCLDSYWNITGELSAFSNALFLSSCLVRKSVSHEFLRIGLINCFTAAPHLAIPLHAIGPMNKVKFSPLLCIVYKWSEEGGNWNPLSVFAGIPLLAETPGDYVTRYRLMPAIKRYAPGLSIREALKFIFTDKIRSPYFYYAYYSRLCPLLSGTLLLKVMFFRFTSGVCFRLPVIKSFGRWLLTIVPRSEFDSTQGSDRL